MSLADIRHKRIFHRQLRYLAICAFGVLGGLLGIGLSANAHSNAEDRYEQAQEFNQELAHTYRVIAGTEPAASVQVGEKFAVAMNDLLESAEGEALTTAIAEFRAGPNDFGGIAEALGYNPFDNTGLRCEVCGRLSDEMVMRLQIISQGGVEELITTELTLSPPEDISYVPHLAVGVLYVLITSTGALVLAIRHDCKHEDYEPQELNWKHTGGTVADQYKRLSKLLAPGHAIILRIQKGRGKDFEATLKHINQAENYRLLQDMRTRAAALPAGKREDFLQRLDAWMESINDQVRAYSGKDREYREHESEALSHQLETDLKAIAVRIETREEALAELNALPGGSS